MPRPRIAVVGMDCHYPDAASPEQLWENVLAGRRAFRRLPDERMRQTDYYSPDPAAPDRFYTTKAAVIEGYEFDRVAYRVAGSTYRSTDLAHWLALDTASGALADAGFPKGDGLADRAVGVVIGNSLNGEFSRANLMRLRWPYVRRTVATALREHGWADGELVGFLDHLEERYKSPFPPIDEDSLAGGLANTIAGRICNHYDFKGGGFTVDGACSSSLLSVAVACDALADGRLDVAIVGGVDLSIDPFEVIGFAKTGALATGEMRVYDRGSNGFWPGEGCGMFVLMRDGDAVAEHRPRHATIAGWAYSSDGKGGITRPEADGHRLALSRAYAAAGFGIDTVAYLEGHGTGTAVGDATELRAFSAERRAADPDAPAAAISTVKGNFGHTKAAAGAAGLLKAVLAVRHQVIPPATSHVDPHPELTGENPALYVPDTARLWPAGAPIRAGVSSMGFGGINAHVIVEHADGARRVGLGRVTERLVRSRQDAELLLLDADSPAGLRELAASLAALTARLSYAELADLAATLHQRLAGRPIRAAVVASTPEEAEQRLGKLITMLDNGARSMFAASDGVFLGARGAAPRIGLLFPGQGAGRHGDGGAVRRRFASVDELYRDRRLPVEGDLVATAVAQPRIVTSSIAGLRVLSDLGVEAVGAVGHSLGELTALHWAGAMDEATALDLSAARGELMQRLGVRGGSMAGVAAEPAAVERLLAGEDVVIAGYNGPRQTVISGPADAVARVGALAAAKGIGVSGIAVSHAFHSTAMAPAALALGARLERERFGPPARRVVSSVTGDTLPADVDVPALLTRQLLDPVRFADAVGRLAADVDLLVEVGPGRVLAGLVGDIAPQVPVISLDTDSRSLSGPLRAIAAAYALGAPVRHSALFEDRLTRPLPLDKEFRFFVSPCETVPDDRLPAAPGRSDAAPERSDGAPGAAPEPVRPPNQGTAIDGTGTAGPGATPGGTEPAGSLEVLLRLAAERAELPLAAVRPEANPLDELHLSSITVGQIVGQASRELGITAPMATTAFATSTLGDLAAMLDELAGTSLAKDVRQPDAVEGVAPWVRAFSIELVKAEAGRPSAHAASTGEWRLFAPERHPLAGALAAALRGAGLGGGVLLCLPRDAGEDELGRMLGAAHAALATDGPSRFVVVGDRRSAGGLAKTLHLETPRIATSVIRLPLPDDMTQRQVTEAAARIVADVAATAGFTEVDYDAAGTRRVPVLRPLPPGDATATSGPLGPGDVILVTGGGKGITAECALSLGRDSGAAVGLVGRSDPDTDPELAANLERMAAAGVTYHYVAADITSEAAARAAVRRIRDRLGPVTAVLHGAGRNVPQPLATLDEATFRRTLAPKIAGLEAVLAAVDPDSLRLLVTFGSIIGRAGLRGEADYATANEWLTELTCRTQEEHPTCRCVALEWSVWSGSGMGERLGVLESLMREGIEPIPLGEGVALLQRLIADPRTPTTVVVMGRVRGLPTLALEQRELPLLRFVDQPRLHYPGIELVVDSELSVGSDPYLADHLLDGDLLFPAVLGMEAMAQVAGALTGRSEAPALEDVEFLRPIVVPRDDGVGLRIAALATTPDTVRVAIRSGETGFRTDHFRATLRYGRPAPDAITTSSPHAGSGRIPLRPAADLYGSVLFQGGRFRRLLGYRALAATSCLADIATGEPTGWFAGFLPADLVLGDPGSRDALMHALQCCVPDATLLPAGVERLWLADRRAVASATQVELHAVERLRDGDTYVYDLDVRDQAGRLVESWRGLRLRAVRKLDGSGPWVPPLLGPYLERRMPPVLSRELRCAVWPDEREREPATAAAEGRAPGGAVTVRRRRTAAALGWALGDTVVVRYRPDGRPEVDGVEVSSSHGAGVTFAVAGAEPVTSDVEAVVSRPAEEWTGLLGPEGFALALRLSARQAEDPSVSATRLWGAMECLRKNGHAYTGVSVDSGDSGQRPGHWVLLRAGDARIATFATALRGTDGPVVFTIMTEGGD